MKSPSKSFVRKPNTTKPAKPAKRTSSPKVRAKDNQTKLALEIPSSQPKDTILLLSSQASPQKMEVAQATAQRPPKETPAAAKPSPEVVEKNSARKTIFGAGN